VFFPLTVPLLYFLRGRLSCEMHNWWLPGRPHESIQQFQKQYRKTFGGGPGYARVLAEYLILAGAAPAVLMVGAASLAAGYLPADSPVLSDLILGWICHFFISACRGGIKYGFRARAAEARLVDHAARRHEEFSFGWYYLPDDWVIFLVRLAAAEAHLPLDQVVVLERNRPEDGCLRPEPSPGGTPLEPPSFPEVRAVAPELLSSCCVDENGLFKVPVFAVLLEIVLPLRGPYGADKRAVPPKESQGSLGLLLRVMALVALLVALLPTILRLALMEREDWSPSVLEVAIVVSCAWLIFICGAFVNMVINASSLVMMRRLRLFRSLANLLEGPGCVFGQWRIAGSVVQIETWDGMRRTLVCFGKNYEVRAVATLGLMFLAIVSVKVFVTYMFIISAVTGRRWRIRHEPVLPGFIGLFPLFFTPAILVALYMGAQFNEYGKLRLLDALTKREREHVLDRVRIVEKAVSGGCSDRMADYEDRRIECVQQAHQLISQTIETQTKPMVLLGTSGRGLFVFSYPLLLSFVTENFVNLAFLSQVISFE